MSRTLLYCNHYRWNHDYGGAAFTAQMNAFHARYPITHLIYGDGPLTPWVPSWAQPLDIPTTHVARRPGEHLNNYNRRLLGLAQAARCLIFPSERHLGDFIHRAGSDRYRLPLHFADPIPKPAKPPKQPRKLLLTPRTEPRSLKLRADRQQWGQKPTPWN